MTKIKHAWTLAALPLAVGLASFAGSASAVNFNIGEVEAQLDTQLSIGASMATSGRDKRLYYLRDGAYLGIPSGEASARTSDDGRLNYKKGDVFSKIFKGSHDLELRYGQSGAFIRGNYWYDFETKDGSQRFYDISDSGRHPLQKGSGIQLLDAFVYHNYSIGDNPGNVRLGRQVVSWGEGVFIQNGINSINPIDASAFRRPGAELKEGLMPVEMLYLSQGLTENLTMEAFYQLKFRATVADNCGTFFSGGDPAAANCTDRLTWAANDTPQGTSFNPFGTDVTNYIVRTRKDKMARDDGQFGVAMRWFVPEINNTEFGFYAMNYHHRAPTYANVPGNVAGLGGNQAAPGYEEVIGYKGDVGAAGYFFEYPEDVRLYGISFGTDIGGTSVAGEISYRPNMPITMNTGDSSRYALIAASGGYDDTHRGMEGVPANIKTNGYNRKDFWQVSSSAVHFIDRVFGASRLALIGEVGANYIGGIGSGNAQTKYGRDSLFGQSPKADGSCASALDPTNPHGASWCENDGFYTDFSWGYRVRASLDYSNVFAGVNLSPTLAWSHDVEGYSQNFTENAKSISVGLNADYASKYNASISYTNFFDGKYNTMVDRDFAAVSVGVSF